METVDITEKITETGELQRMTSGDEPPPFLEGHYKQVVNDKILLPPIRSIEDPLDLFSHVPQDTLECGVKRKFQ